MKYLKFVILEISIKQQNNTKGHFRHTTKREQVIQLKYIVLLGHK